MTTTSKASSDIDESLYSRQLYVLGHEGQKRMAGASVLIIGLSGLGVEVAKNVILAGAKSVALFDPKPTSFNDLSSQFFLSEKDVGIPRAEASIDKLAELNPYVHVSLLPGAIGELEDALRDNKYTVVVLIDQDLSLQLRLSELAHDLGTCFIASNVYGVFGSVFCDFGDNFIVLDKDGEQPASSLVASAVYDKASATAVITTLEETRHNLITGDVVLISDIVGSIGSLLNGKEFTVTVLDLFSFEVSLLNHYTATELSAVGTTSYERSGYVNQIKQPTSMSFEKLSKSLKQPGPFVGDDFKLFRAGLLHAIFQSYHAFVKKFGYHPAPGNVIHAQAFYDLVLESSTANSTTSAEEVKENESLVKKFALTSAGNLSPVCGFFGGVVGQEVLKACSGKFSPIKQWLYYDFIDALPKDPLPIEEVQPRDSRYDGQIAVYGASFQLQLHSLNLFLVGAGAIGCEVLKNWSMMGVGCHQSQLHSSASFKSGSITVTDPDHIEKSNLSRQFLFRNSDIHTSKSKTAARAAGNMNRDTNIVALEQKVCPETETHFNDLFYESIDIICTALDNIEARLYVDQKALFYHKPMLESGTLGTKGHTQVVIPHITEHYGATRDPPEKTIPMCTLKHFPNQIEHTLQWAREWFAEVFQQTPSDALGYMSDPNYIDSLVKQQNVKLDMLTHVQETFLKRPSSFEDCIVWARLKFEELFSQQIQQLLYNLPINKVTAEGTPFWSGAKKPPSAISFSTSDPMHMEFIVSAAVMRARMYGLTVPTLDPSYLSDIAGAVKISPFQPQDNVKIATTEEEAKNNGNSGKAPIFGADIDQICDEIIRSLPSRDELSAAKVTIEAAEFDKDVDEHMRVIASVANLRARNYSIPEVDLHKARGIAGKIIPAIATTTALVTGAICMELYKLVLLYRPGVKDLDLPFANAFFNLAIPLFTSMSPEPPKPVKTVIKGVEWKWTQWDRIDLTNPGMTMKDLIAYMQEKYEVDLVMLSAGVTIVFSAMLPAKKANERKAMTVKQLVEFVCKQELPSSQKYLVLETMAENVESGEEVDLPYIRFCVN